MHRRDILKGAGVIALYGSLPAIMSEFLASCKSGDKLQPQFFSPEEFSLLENVIDILLPRTTTPGGLDTNTPIFIDKVVNDCMNEEDQQRIRKGLQAINNPSFSSLNDDEKQQLISAVDEKAFKDDAESAWFRIIKKIALIGHFTSREGMTTALKYAKVPGDYKACIPYKKGEKAMAKTFLLYW